VSVRAISYGLCVWVPDPDVLLAAATESRVGQLRTSRAAGGWGGPWCGRTTGVDCLASSPLNPVGELGCARARPGDPLPTACRRFNQMPLWDRVPVHPSRPLDTYAGGLPTNVLLHLRQRLSAAVELDHPALAGLDSALECMDGTDVEAKTHNHHT
jgi:hypothetical protein